MFALAHGAGAGMTHPFLEAVSARLFDAGVATLRYQFPYMEAGRKHPDTPAVATATVRAAVEKASALAPDLPLLAGGKSFGGRMTSTAAAGAPLSGVHGLVFLGFPLHAPGRRGTNRARHLEEVGVPMLFLQGTRDPLADLELVRGVVDGLGNRATLHVVEGGDHSFRVLKRSGRTEEDVMGELQSAIAAWADGVLGPGGATL
jgi:predicted alpha/beta-hydrolase family hydrolase